MIKKVIKNLIYIFFLICIICFPFKSFSADLKLNLNYGINNQAKAGKKIPIELIVENKEAKQFDGFIHVYMYYRDDCCVEYKYPLSVKEGSITYKNFDVTLGATFNTILINITDLDNNYVCSEKFNIDSQSLNKELIIGILSDAPWKLDYFNGLSLNDGKLKTKTVNIEKNNLQRNTSLLDSIDILLLSEINTKTFSKEIENIIYSYLAKGNVVLLGSGDYGTDAIPNVFEKLLVSPVFVDDIVVKFQNKQEEQQIKIKRCNYNFESNVDVLNINNNVILRNKSIGTGVLSNSTINFAELRSYKNFNQEVAKEIITKALGNSRLNKLQQMYDNKNVSSENDLIDIINIVDATILPNMKILMLVVIFYIGIFALSLIYCLTRRRRKKYFVYIAVFLSVVFSINTYIIFMNSRKKHNFASFVKIIDITDISNQENMYLTTLSPNSLIYNLKVNLSNKVYSIIDTITKKGNLSVDIENDLLNKTTISNEEDKISIKINNKNNFVPSFFSIENNNVNLDLYNIESNINFIDNKLSGYIHNKTNFDLKDLSIVFYDGIVKIGDLDKGKRININDFKFQSVPVLNNYQISEKLVNYPNNKIVKNYLDSHVNGYYDNAKVLAFIYDKSLYPVESSDIKDVQGVTLISLSENVNKEDENFIEESSLKYEINNISGQYDVINNTIDGLGITENEYSFDSNKIIGKIYLQNLDSNYTNNLDYAIPFEGNIYIFNRKNNTYDLCSTNEINKEELINYLSPSNSIIIRFESRIEDMLNRKIYLPVVKALELKGNIK